MYRLNGEMIKGNDTGFHSAIPLGQLSEIAVHGAASVAIIYIYQYMQCNAMHEDYKIIISYGIQNYIVYPLCNYFIYDCMCKML